MVQAWFMDDSTTEDQRCDHHLNPPQYVPIEQLKNTAGVEYFFIHPDEFSNSKELESLKRQRGYTYQDVVEIAKEKLPNYEERIRMFFEEHLHTDEEIRYVLEGSGFFDVRDKNDKWVRIKVVPGDLLIVPAGIYHRFTLDTKNYVKAARLFVGEPIWTPHNRPCDDMECRKEYLQRLQAGFAN